MSAILPVATRPILRLKQDVQHQLEDVALVALQHLLPSISPLFARFIDAGILADHVFILGKPYSTVPAVVDTLLQSGCYVHSPGKRLFAAGQYSESFRDLVLDFWQTVRDRLPSSVTRLIILDEGGWLCWAVPDALIAEHVVVAVEHTMQGLFTTPSGGRPYPIIQMAASAAKTRFESTVIADAIIERLEDSIKQIAGLNIGVIGLGNIGQAVAMTLDKKGIGRLQGYDIVSGKGSELRFLKRTRSLSQLVGECDVLLGCTGRDTLEPGSALHRIKGTRWLASCSSGDVEFLRAATLLTKRLSSLRSDPFRDARGMIGDTEVVLLNGGFPLNFDRILEREHSARIQLTRELTYASVLYAALCVNEECGTGGVMLDPEVQQMLVEAWLLDLDAASLFPNWVPHPVAWWERHSAGQRLPCDLGSFIGLHHGN